MAAVPAAEIFRTSRRLRLGVSIFTAAPADNFSWLSARTLLGRRLPPQPHRGGRAGPANWGERQTVEPHSSLTAVVHCRCVEEGRVVGSELRNHGSGPVDRTPSSRVLRGPVTRCIRVLKTIPGGRDQNARWRSVDG